MSSIRFALIALVVFVSIPWVRAENPPASQPAKPQPVDFHAMQTLLPDKAAGVARSDLGGDNSTVGDMQIANANADYAKPDSDGSDAHASITISDYGAAPQLMAAMTAWRFVPINIQGNDGYQRTAPFNGYPAFESYTKDGDSRTMIVLVADRFLVNVSTYHVAEAEFQKLIKELPLEKLSKLK